MLVEVGKFTFLVDFVILEMEEDKEDFDALLDKGSKIFHSIEGTILEEKLFADFDEFMAMTTDENSESESDIEEPPFKKITFNTDHKIKTSLEEPPSNLELKPLPDNLEYVSSIWKAFKGNTRDLGSFGEETDKITNQHQDSSRFKVSAAGDGVTIYTRRRHTSSGDGVTTSLDGASPHRLNSDLDDSTL
ncbi:hypothetical protein Tco_0285432 [Tanacetum coccineum]